MLGLIGRLTDAIARAVSILFTIGDGLSRAEVDEVGCVTVFVSLWYIDEANEPYVAELT